RYYAAYEERFELPVYRPVTVTAVCDRDGRLRVESDRGLFSARGIINATGTWERPHIPDVPGRDRFRGRQLHTKDYRTAEEVRVRRGRPAGSVVSATGIPVTPAIEAMRERGVLERRPMFDEVTEAGVRWSDGTTLRADVILWCTGFRSALDHLAPLMLREPNG